MINIHKLLQELSDWMITSRLHLLSQPRSGALY